MLRVVDISSHQEGIDPASLDCDAVIVKATGGTSYVNDRAHEAWKDWNELADAVLASGKMLGLYAYAMEYGAYNEAADEARHFLDTIRDYIGKAVLVLDFEKDAQGLPVSWAREWLDIVASETGATPMFYAYASYLNSRDHSEIAHYPLWMASYLNRYIGAGWVEDPDNIWATSSWDGMAMYQYTSDGYIDGYWNRLDLSVFYGDRHDWKRLEGGAMSERIEAMVQHAIAIAEDDSHGYSWADRWNVDRDCSSLMYDSADAAGFPVGRGPDKTRYTGTMPDDFQAAGFTMRGYGEVEPYRGCIFLRDPWGPRGHTEMCLGDGMTVGAHIAETGGVYGEPGDQTGDEISIAPDPGGWDYILCPPTDDAESEEFDMAEAIFYIDDDHEGYLNGDVVYWNPSAGFCYMEHPDSIWLLKQCNESIAEIHSSSNAPWLVRAYHVTNPAVAKKTYGRRN